MIQQPPHIPPLPIVPWLGLPRHTAGNSKAVKTAGILITSYEDDDDDDDDEEAHSNPLCPVQGPRCPRPRTCSL